MLGSMLQVSTLNKAKRKLVLMFIFRVFILQFKIGSDNVLIVIYIN